MADRDRSLVSRMADGDEKAFEELYNLYARKVYAYLRSRNTDEQTANDILQDTFLAAWRSCGRFQGGSEVLTWIIGIARHKLADAVRARERARAAPLEDEHAVPDTSAQTVERLTLHEALAGLDEEHRELLHMVFVLGMSYAEAAKVLEVPEGTVKSRMFTLKRQLAGQLA